jgi:hypothetical protein
MRYLKLYENFEQKYAVVNTFSGDFYESATSRVVVCSKKELQETINEFAEDFSLDYFDQKVISDTEIIFTYKDDSDFSSPSGKIKAFEIEPGYTIIKATPKNDAIEIVNSYNTLDEAKAKLLDIINNLEDVNKDDITEYIESDGLNFGDSTIDYRFHIAH